MISELYEASIARSSGSKPYMVARGQTLTYGELDLTVRRLANFFQQQGLVEGDVVLLNVANDLQLAGLYLACAVSGLAAVVTDPALPSLDAVLQLAQPRLAFVDRSRTEQALATAGLTVIAVDPPQRKTRGVFKKLLKKKSVATAESSTENDYPGLLESVAPISGALPGAAPDTTALVLFTSGTTSEPKGVEITQRAMALQMELVCERLRVDEQAQIFNSLPLHHTDGITNGVTLALVAAATVHRPSRFSVNELPATMDYIFREGISHLFTVPTVLALMQRLGGDYTDTFQSGDFKVLVSSAGMLPAELWQAFEQRFRIRVCNAYGLTETVSVFTFCGPDEESYRLGTVGVPVASEVRIVDAGGVNLGAGEEGELLVRGDLVMKGYLNNAEATAAVLDEGWFSTGDQAVIAADGKIEIRGRKKSIIVRGGVNIHPGEIVDAALRHGSVVHAVAFGEADATWGELAILCVVEDPAQPLSDQQLQAHLLSVLAEEKMPDEIHRFADFPTGPAGKVLLTEVAEQVRLRRESRAFSAAGEPYDVVVTIGAALLKVAPETLARDSSAENVPGWDSLLHLNFILAVEESYGVEFQPREIMAVQTLGDLVDLASRYRGQD